MDGRHEGGGMESKTIAMRKMMAMA